jgi:IPT/TIG domain
MADIQPVLDLMEAAQRVISGLPQPQSALDALAQARERLVAYAQQRDADEAQLQAAYGRLEQQLNAAQADMSRLREQIDSQAPAATPIELARSFRDVVGTVQSEARAASGVGVTIRSMDVEVKGLVTVDQQGTSVVLPQPGTGIDAGTLSTLRLSFVAIPVPTARTPTVTTIEPAAGPPSGGTTVTVSGTGLTDVTSVLFGSSAATNVQIRSDAELLATSPPGSGQVDITVTSPAGASPVLPGDQFTYAEPPVVEEVKPNAGPSNGGTRVEIVGHGLTGASGVLFGPTAAAQFEVLADSQMTAISPPGIGTVPVTVTGIGGTSVLAPGASFTYQQVGLQVEGCTMPLPTDDINEARAAYEALEARNEDLRRTTQAAQASAATLLQANRGLIDTVDAMRQRILDLEARKAELDNQVNAIAQIRADLTVAELAQAVGLAIALGTATMADRTVASVDMNVQSYLTRSDGPLGLRLQQPELAGFPIGLSSTRFTIAQVPVGPQAPAPRPLYTVLADKQRLYGEPWLGDLPSATRLIAVTGQTLAYSGSWTVPYLAAQASEVATLEADVADALAAAGQERASGLGNAALALAEGAAAVAGRSRPVAGDVWMLAQLLDASTRTAQALRT